MALGPIELLVVKFPGNRFSGEIAPALEDLVDKGLIRIIDLIFVIKDEYGNVRALEMTELDEDVYAALDPFVDDVAGVLTEEDVRHLSAALEPNSSAGIMLFENTWAARFAEAVRNANGELVLNERIPRAVIDQLMAAQA
jgi:uncharacterized membrane protein